jgi:threonine synthase
MPEPIRFYSTNRSVPPVTLDEALLQGQAPDRGLFMPERFPALSPDELAALAGKPYRSEPFARRPTITTCRSST